MTFILPKKTRVLWQLRFAVAFIFVCIIIFVTAPLNIWVLLVVALTFIFSVFFVFIYVPTFIKNYKMIIYNDCLCINKGVFIKTLIIVPSIRLVVVKNVATPIMALLKLRLVLIKASKGWIIVPELETNATKRLLGVIRGESA